MFYSDNFGSFLKFLFGDNSEHTTIDCVFNYLYIFYANRKLTRIHVQYGNHN